MDSKTLEKKLSAVKDTSEDIQELSRWCIHHRSNYHSIVQAWSRAVRKAKVGHRLTLFYVCNDVVQNARRKKYLDLVQHFATAIKEVTPFVRDEKIKKKIVRIFSIWEERGVYDSKLITELSEIIENVGTVNATENEAVLSTFQLGRLVEGIRSLISFEKTSKCLLDDLKTQEFILTPEEVAKVQATVKERGASRERLEEFEESVVSLECYITSLHKEIEERTKVVSLLEQAEIFYETQRGEAKLVANAYKSFSNQVKTLKARLKEKLPTLKEPRLVKSPSSPKESEDGEPKEESESLFDRENHQITTANSSFMDSNFQGTTTQLKDVLDLDAENESDSSIPNKSDYHKEPSTVISISPSDNQETQDLPKVTSKSSYKREERRSLGNHESELDREQREFEFQLSKITNRPFQETKPMSARELLDTFGKSYLANNASAPSYSTEPSPQIHSSAQHLTTTAPSLPPTAPPPPIPQTPLPPPPPPPPGPVPVPFSLAPTSQPPLLPANVALPIPLPPPKPSSSGPPSEFLPPQASESYIPPPTSTSPKLGFPSSLPNSEIPPYPPPFAPPLPPATANENGGSWPWMVPPPPPPPPLPPNSINDPAHFPTQGEENNSWTGSAQDYPQTWPYNQYENIPEEPEVEETDNRNWGEPPGNEELQAYSQSENSLSPTQSFPPLLPPPPAPSLSSFISRDSKELNRSSSSEERSNLVNIEPCDDNKETSDKNSQETDYTCYDYRSLAQESERPVPLNTLVDPKVKKHDGSGSDMDISDSDSITEDQSNKRKSSIHRADSVSKNKNKSFKDFFKPFPKRGSPIRSSEHNSLNFPLNEAQDPLSGQNDQTQPLIKDSEHNDFEPNYKRQRTHSMHQEDKQEFPPGTLMHQSSLPDQPDHPQTDMAASPAPSWEDDYNSEEIDMDNPYVDVDTVSLSRALDHFRDQQIRHDFPEHGGINNPFFHPGIHHDDKVPTFLPANTNTGNFDKHSVQNNDKEPPSMTQVIQSFISEVREGDRLNPGYDDSYQPKSGTDGSYREAEEFLNNLQSNLAQEGGPNLKDNKMCDRDPTSNAQPIVPLYNNNTRNEEAIKTPFQNFDVSLFKRKEPLLPLGVIHVDEPPLEEQGRSHRLSLDEPPPLSQVIKEEFCRSPEPLHADLTPRKEPHFSKDEEPPFKRHESPFQRLLPNDRHSSDFPPLSPRGRGHNSLLGPGPRHRPTSFSTSSFKEKLDDSPRGRGYRFRSPRERGSFEKGRGSPFLRPQRFSTHLDSPRGRGGFSPRGPAPFSSPRIRGSRGLNFQSGRGRGFNEFKRGRGGFRGSTPWR